VFISPSFTNIQKAAHDTAAISSVMTQVTAPSDGSIDHLKERQGSVLTSRLHAPAAPYAPSVHAPHSPRRLLEQPPLISTLAGGCHLLEVFLVAQHELPGGEVKGALGG
jgi:hypothetical protein